MEYLIFGMNPRHEEHVLPREENRKSHRIPDLLKISSRHNRGIDLSSGGNGRERPLRQAACFRQELASTQCMPSHLELLEIDNIQVPHSACPVTALLPMGQPRLLPNGLAHNNLGSQSDQDDKEAKGYKPSCHGGQETGHFCHAASWG